MKSARTVRWMGYAVALWSCLAIASVYAQQVTLEIQPRTLRLNEAATLKLTFINLNPPQSPAIPDIPGFEIQYVGQEQQFQIINGQQERRLAYNYRLQPRATGQFQLGPFSMQVNGNEMNFDPIMVEVLPASTSGGTGAAGETINDLVFAKLLLPRSEVFLQERFDVELALYYRGVQLDRGIQLQNMPSTGLNLEDFQEIASSREAIQNEVYDVRRFRMRGTAITAGTFDLAPMVRVNVLVRRERSRDPFFGEFDAFFGTHEAQPLLVPAEPTKVVIRPLPTEGKPDNFSGAVGRFNMEAGIQPMEVSAGDPITLTIHITGVGNFESISMPSINPGSDFRRYDPKLIASDRDRKVFEQVFIPRSETITELPAISFVYFDPEASAYKTIVKGPLPLTVKAGASAAPQVVQSPTSGTTPAERAPLGIDIIGLKRTVTEWTPEESVIFSDIKVAWHVTPLLALCLLFVWRKRRDAIAGNVGRHRQSLAPRSARAALRQAEIALKQNNADAFHAAIWQALADYVAHRANLQPGEVTPDLILARLQKGRLAADKLQTIHEILHTCEEARFSGGGGSQQDWQQQLQRTQDVLRACEKISITS